MIKIWLHQGYTRIAHVHVPARIGGTYRNVHTAVHDMYDVTQGIVVVTDI